MKRLLAALPVILTLNGCFAAMSQQAMIEIDASRERVRLAELDQLEMARRGASAEDVYAKLRAVDVESDKIRKICDNEAMVPPIQKGVCYSYADQRDRLARMQLFAADRHAAVGDKALAKQMYRNLIIEHPGPYYESLRKVAEFGLEDLAKK